MAWSLPTLHTQGWMNDYDPCTDQAMLILLPRSIPYSMPSAGEMRERMILEGIIAVRRRTAKLLANKRSKKGVSGLRDQVGSWSL